MVGVCVLTVIPLLASLTLSLTDATGNHAVDRWTWIGAGNYERALGVIDHDPSMESGTGDTDQHTPRDPKFRLALANSLIFTGLAVPLGLCASLAVALLLHRPARGVRWFRLVIYLPHLLGGVATIVIWSWLFNPQFGWVNEGIRTLYAVADPLVAIFLPGGTNGWPVPRWLYSRSGGKPAVVIMHVWTMGGSMLIFLAARQHISTLLYEAATLDGAGLSQTYWHVLLPAVRPATVTVALLSFVYHWQSFLDPLLYLSDFMTFPVSLGLRMYQSMAGTWANLLMAASLIALVPVVIVFLLAERHIMRGLGVVGRLPYGRMSDRNRRGSG